MITLTYPYTSPTLTIQLPNPRLGNPRQLEKDFIIQFSASSRVYTYIKSLKREKLLLTLFDLTFTQRANLKNFLYTAVNGLCGYLDYKNVQWKGVFINNPFEELSIDRNYGSITLEFYGQKL